MERVLEREAELSVLQDAVRAASGGGGSLILVAGEAGIGKTTLVRALRMRVAAEAAFFMGACESLSVPVPLGPVREIAAALGEVDLVGSDGDDRLVLTRRLMEVLAERGPAVVVVEDAHWADASTLDVLRLLARRLDGASVLLLVTYRDDEAATNRELGRLLGDLATSRLVRRLELRPLSAAGVRELAEPAGVDAIRLSRVTGGNPFLVVEAIAAGRELPSSVRDATLARAARLGPAAREVVEAAAVVGQRAAPWLLETVLPGSTPAVEEALARGVMVADGQVLGFRHELIRAAIESSLSPPRRAALHARVLVALTDRGGPVDAARLAHHAELAGRSADACRFAALAAREAERVGALRETSLQAERALRLGNDLSGSDRFELLLLHSRAANFAHTDLEVAARAAREAIDVADGFADRVRQGRGLVALAYALWSLERVREAKDAVAQAVDVLKDAGDDAVLARALATRIRVEATAFDPGRAIDLAPHALELAVRAGLEETRIDVSVSVGLARGHLGDGSSLALLADVARAARSRSLTIMTVRAHVNLVFVAAALRKHVWLDEAVDEARALLDEYQTVIPATAVELYRALSLLDRGRWDEARAAAERSPHGVGELVALACTVHGIIASRRGEPDAPRLLQRAWAVVAELPESSRHGRLRVAEVEAAWLRGDRREVMRQLRDARETPATRWFARTGGELALWGRRHGVQLEAPAGAPEPVLRELAGDWRGAMRGWRELEAPYEAALAALPGHERAAREAMAALHRLGATAAARAFARHRVEAGARAPRGPRQSTRAHPAGMTRREEEVLEQLATGATNPVIAATLHLSQRTVAHHVSAILRKLGASTRLAAVEEARARGLLTQDRQVSPQR